MPFASAVSFRSPVEAPAPRALLLLLRRAAAPKKKSASTTLTHIVFVFLFLSYPGAHHPFVSVSLREWCYLPPSRRVTP
jgi:hypothetical protein